MPIKNWFYLRKDAPGLKKETIETPSDTYVNIVDVNSPNSGNIMSVSDFAAQSRPYKVYTALLTQKGGDDSSSLNDELLTVGVTYQISDLEGSGYDFTNVGAPNNDNGTFFVATGTTPNSWGDLNVNLNFNLGAPEVTVLENTIGNVWFTYDAAGQYYINSNDLFIENKTFTIVTNNIDWFDAGVVPTITLDIQPESSVYIRTGGVDEHYNDVLNNVPIEIRVYN